MQTRSKANLESQRSAVFWYIPNLIGYGRVVAMLVAFWFGPDKDYWQLAIISYLMGFVGDLVDGYAARAFNQSSGFGAVLDMVTDRTSTAGLVILISSFYPTQLFWFILLVVIDFSSHWFHCFSTAKSGHHKAANTLKQRNFILRAYYGIYPFFGFCCVGQEVFYILLYILHFQPDFLSFQGTAYGELLARYVAFPACFTKQIVNLAQLLSACNELAAQDVADKSKASKK